MLLGLLLASPLKADTILILGDSLSASYGMQESAGWVALLRPKLPAHRLVNAAVSGETSAGALRRLPTLLADVRPELVFVLLGGNDGLRGFPIDQLKNNLKSIIAMSTGAGAKVMLSEVMVPTNYGPRYAKAFADVYHQLGSLNGVITVPFFMPQIIGDSTLMQRDGIHPNETAQPKIADFLLPFISAALAEE